MIKTIQTKVSGVLNRDHTEMSTYREGELDAHWLNDRKKYITGMAAGKFLKNQLIVSSRIRFIRWVRQQQYGLKRIQRPGPSLAFFLILIIFTYRPYKTDELIFNDSALAETFPLYVGTNNMSSSMLLYLRQYTILSTISTSRIIHN